MANERYQHTLWTGSGSTEVTLQFQESGDVEGELHMRWMGSDEYRYRLSGKYERISDTCGAIFIHRVSVQQFNGSSPSTALSEIQAEEVDLTALEIDLMYEYIKVVRSPVYYHPQHAFNAMAPVGYAGWNKIFDLLLITDPFVVEVVESFKEMDEAPDEHLQKRLRTLVYVLDKLKFAKVTEDEPVEMLHATDQRAVEQLARAIFSPPVVSKEEE